MKKKLVFASLMVLSVSTNAQRIVVRMDDIGASHAENLAVIKC